MVDDPAARTVVRVWINWLVRARAGAAFATPAGAVVKQQGGSASVEAPTPEIDRVSADGQHASDLAAGVARGEEQDDAASSDEALWARGSANPPFEVLAFGRREQETHRGRPRHDGRRYETDRAPASIERPHSARGVKWGCLIFPRGFVRFPHHA
jgi:hypothetical protein